MNSEVVKKWCDINKLSINMGKTNFMVIKSAWKRDMEISLNISNSDGSSHVLERKQCIKYLGVMIDESLTWKYRICSRISRNIEIKVLFIYTTVKTNLLNNRPFYSCRLSDQVSEWQRGWSWPCFDTDLKTFIVPIKLFLC